MAENRQNGPSIFRQASLDRAASPERTDDYLRLPDMGWWMAGAAAALLALGAALYFTLGRG